MKQLVLLAVLALALFLIGCDTAVVVRVYAITPDGYVAVTLPSGERTTFRRDEIDGRVYVGSCIAVEPLTTRVVDCTYKP